MWKVLEERFTYHILVIMFEMFQYRNLSENGKLLIIPGTLTLSEWRKLAENSMFVQLDKWF